MLPENDYQMGPCPLRLPAFGEGCHSVHRIVTRVSKPGPLRLLMTNTRNDSGLPAAVTASS